MLYCSFISIQCDRSIFGDIWRNYEEACVRHKSSNISKNTWL